MPEAKKPGLQAAKPIELTKKSSDEFKIPEISTSSLEVGDLFANAISGTVDQLSASKSEEKSEPVKV